MLPALQGTDEGALDYALNRGIDAWYNDKKWFHGLQKRVMEQVRGLAPGDCVVGARGARFLESGGWKEPQREGRTPLALPALRPLKPPVPFPSPPPMPSGLELEPPGARLH